MEWLDLIAQVSGSAIRFSVPLLFACLAGLYSERAGVFDIGLEGKMLAFGIPMFPEGETSPAFVTQAYPTITLNLYHLCEAAVLQRGQEVNRQVLQQVAQQRIDTLEKKGRRCEPAAAVGPGKTAARASVNS